MEAPPLLHWLSTCGHCTALVTGAKEGSPLPSRSLRDQRMTGSLRQISLPVPREWKARPAHAHLRTGGHLSHCLYHLCMKTWTLFQTCANCAPSYTYVGGKQKCVRKKAELSTSAHVIWENRTKSGYSGFRFYVRRAGRGLQGWWGFLSLPPWLVVLLIGSCHHPSGVNPVCLAECLHLCPSSHTHWLRTQWHSPESFLLLASVRRSHQAEMHRNYRRASMFSGCRSRLWIWCLQLSVEEGSSLPCG